MTLNEQMLLDVLKQADEAMLKKANEAVEFAMDNPEEEKKKTVGRKVVDTAATIGKGALAGGAAVVGGLKALSKPLPPQQMDSRHIV